MLFSSQYELTSFKNGSTTGYFPIKPELTVLGGAGLKTTLIKTVTSEGGASVGPGAHL